MPEKKKVSRAQLDAAMEKVRAAYGGRANFKGADVGYRYVAGEKTDEVCVRVHVERKIPREQVLESELFPAEIDGIPLDVIQGPYRATRSTSAFDHQRRYEQVVAGISCGRVGDGTGTIGAVVIDNRTGAPAILSNWHVLAGASARTGDSILQPGGIDGGVPVRDEVARLTRWMLEPAGDAAIATLSGTRSWLPVQYGNFDALEAVRNSRLGEVLVKSGRTTGQTRARVDGEGIYRIDYEVAPGVVEPRDITGFKLVPEKDGNPNNDELSAGGDSGSVWSHPNSKEAVGLHFAGETSPVPTAEHAVACNMTDVLERLDVRLATFDDLLAPESSEASPAPRRVPEDGRIGLTPHPDWPWPVRNWPWPVPPLPPGGGWPQPAPGPGPWPGPWPGPFPGPLPGPWPGPRDPWTAVGDRMRSTIRLEDAHGAATKPTGWEIRSAVLDVFDRAFETFGGNYMAHMPSSLYDGNINRWRAKYRGDVENALQRDHYPTWQGLSDPTLTGLFGQTLNSAYVATVNSIAAHLNVSNPWD